MKKTLFRIGRVALAAGLAVGTANAQGNVIRVGELVTNEIALGGDWNGTNLIFHIGVDPSGSGLANVLYYDLPALFATALPGDVQITDPWEGNTTNDVVRFDGNGHLIFYSNGNGILGGADISSVNFATILANPLSNRLVLSELGVGGDLEPSLNYNYVVYTPAGGTGPGYVPGGPSGGSPIYWIISDVPEPGTLALAGTGFAVLLFINRWRKK